MRFLREAKFPSPNPSTPFSEGNPSLDDSKEAILLALTEQRFASIRLLSRLTHLPGSAVDRRLTECLEFHLRHFRLVPHRLITGQKSDRVEHLSTDHEMIWLQFDEKVS